MPTLVPPRGSDVIDVGCSLGTGGSDVQPALGTPAEMRESSAQCVRGDPPAVEMLLVGSGSCSSRHGAFLSPWEGPQTM